MLIRNALLAAVGGLGVVAASQARAGVTVNLSPGTTNVTTGLTGFQTFGDQMTGMVVQTFFTGGTSEKLTWKATRPGAGGVTGTGWSLAESGDTFSSDWTLANTSAKGITRVLIDAGKGSAVFDTDFEGNEGTPGSFSGSSFNVTSDSGNHDIVATYRDQVALKGAKPAGDIYRNLEIDFTGGFAAGSTLTFNADTDSIKFAGDIMPGGPGPPVPLPAAARPALGLLGAAGLGSLARKRRGATA